MKLLDSSFDIRSTISFFLLLSFRGITPVVGAHVAVAASHGRSGAGPTRAGGSTEVSARSVAGRAIGLARTVVDLAVGSRGGVAESEEEYCGRREP